MFLNSKISKFIKRKNAICLAEKPTQKDGKNY